MGCFVAGCGGFVAGRLEEAAAAEEARRKAAAGRKGPGGRPMPKPLVGTLPPVSAQCYVGITTAQLYRMLIAPSCGLLPTDS